MKDQWIWIPNWEKFQHYKDRNPPWVKNYTDLLHRDDYLELSSHLRGVLHGIWLEYAMSSRRLRANTATLTSRLRVRVTTPDLTRLNQAGFLDLVASSVLAARLQDASTLLASRAPAHSQEAEAETKEPKGSEAVEIKPKPKDPHPTPTPTETNYATNNGARRAEARPDDDIDFTPNLRSIQ